MHMTVQAGRGDAVYRNHDLASGQREYHTP